jgi:RNA polymerase sporulation-specific sigma factor
VSLNKPIYEDDSERTLLDVITESWASNPEEQLIIKEDVHLIEEHISKMLSGFEKEALIRYLDGKSYQEISLELNRHVKSIDNALQRVKRKLVKFFEER